MENWAYKNPAQLFLGNCLYGWDWPFLAQHVHFQGSELKYFQCRRTSQCWETIHILFAKYQKKLQKWLCTYNLAKNIKILTRSIFCSSANLGLFVTIDGAFESWHQGEFVLGIYPRNRYCKTLNFNPLLCKKQKGQGRIKSLFFYIGQTIEIWPDISEKWTFSLSIDIWDAYIYFSLAPSPFSAPKKTSHTRDEIIKGWKPRKLHM